MTAKKEPWKTENWFVSPWNYLPEVTRDFTPPKQVKIHDITGGNQGLHSAQAGENP